jgi:hypothetical protein
LPCEIRVTATTHPLFGRLLTASAFKRLDGELLLVVSLPDGSPGTIRANATSIIADADADAALTVLTVEGLRHLHRLSATLLAVHVRPKTRK